MSMNRLHDDTCYYGKALQQSVNPLAYTLDPIKYEHCRTCRMKLGIVGGTAASHMTGASLVDTESELRNQTRAHSRCPANKYVPGRDMPITGMKHLQECQMIHYKPVIAPVWAVQASLCSPSRGQSDSLHSGT
jgi:hypothetical protein